LSERTAVARGKGDMQIYAIDIGIMIQ